MTPEAILQFLTQPVISFWVLIIIGTALVVSPNRLTKIYPADDRNIGLALIITGSVYVQMTILEPSTGFENLTERMSQVGVFVGFVSIIIRNGLGVDY